MKAISRVALGLVALASVTMAARRAEAQGLDIGAGAGPSLGPASVENSPELDDDVKESPRSIKLFDKKRSVLSYELEMGPLWSRRIGDGTRLERRNFERGAPLASEIAFSTVDTTRAKGLPLFLVGERKTLLRIIDDKSFSWGVFHSELGGGLALGPLELQARVRLTFLSVDIFHAQPSVQLLTPGVMASAGLHLGTIRIDVGVHSDYLWRWFGPSYSVRGISFGLGFDARQPKVILPQGP